MTTAERSAETRHALAVLAGVADAHDLPLGVVCQRTRSFPRGRTSMIPAGGQFISLSAVS